MRDRDMPRGRWAAVGTIVATAVVVLASPPAHAGGCGGPVSLVQGEESVLPAAVTVGDQPTNDVAFQLPDELEMTESPESPGWVVSTDGPWVRFTGQEIAPNECVTFDITVRATQAGTFRVNAFHRVPNGDVIQLPAEGEELTQPGGTTIVVDRQGPPNPAFEQTVTVTAPDDGSGRPIALLAAGTVLVLAIGFLVIRRPRSRPPEEPEP